MAVLDPLTAPSGPTAGKCQNKRGINPTGDSSYLSSPFSPPSSLALPELPKSILLGAEPTLLPKPFSSYEGPLW